MTVPAEGDATLADDHADVDDDVHADLRRERLREGITMALYLSLSLLAVMVALPSGVTAEDGPGTAGLLGLTSLGLLAAHWIAFRVSARLAHRGRLAAEHLELLGAQLAGGIAVTGVAVMPVLLLGTSPGVLVAELLLVAFIAGVGYAAARTVPVSRTRALGYVGAVVVVSLLALWIKGLVHH